MGWRKQQRHFLQPEIDNLRANSVYNFDTFREEVRKGKYVWPEEFERFISDAYKNLDIPKEEIAQRIEGEFPKYLQQHYEFLGREMNNLSGMSVQTVLDHLHEIQKHWQPYLDDRSRLGKHTATSVLDTVYKRIRRIVELVPTYERAMDLLQKIDTAKVEAEMFLNQKKGYLDAVKILESCLRSAPPESDPVYDLLQDNYEEIAMILKGFQDLSDM